MNPQWIELRRAFLLFLQAEKNAALSPKLPPNAEIQTRANVALLSQGVTTVLKDINRFITPLVEEPKPNTHTHFYDTVFNEWYPLEDLPPALREPIVPIKPVLPRKPRKS